MTPKIVEQVSNLPGWALGLGAFAAVYILLRPKETGKFAVSVGKGVIDVSGDIFQGVIEGVTGGAIPATSDKKCCDSIAAYDAATGAGEKIAASFNVSLNCPAADYLRWASGKGKPSACKSSVSTKKASPVIVAPGGGILNGPSFEDYTKDCGYGDPRLCEDWGMDWKPTFERPEIVPIGGIRG